MHNIVFVNIALAPFGRPTLSPQDETLIAACNDNAVLSRLSAHHVYALSLFKFKGNTPDSGLRIFLNACLRFFRPVPMTKEETTIFNTLLKLFVVVALVNMRITLV